MNKENSWRSILIPPEASIMDAMAIIDSSPYLIAVVVDKGEKLLGTVTDGDIRRGILRKEPMDAPVSHIMHDTPLSASIHDAIEKIQMLLKTGGLNQIPLLDGEGRVRGIETLSTLTNPRKKDNPVLLMAGGLGTRLRPLTDNCPKPLLNICDKPILQRILEDFVRYGFHNFYISVNYKGEMIESHFGDGAKWGVSIRYLREKRRMGTAGALSLIEDKPDKPMIVMNGDLLTKINFNHLLDFHCENGTSATLCVRNHTYQIPFGVVALDNCRLQALDEKPMKSAFINAGIYVLNPELIDLVPSREYFDMTELFEKLLQRGENPAVFPIREYWLDIGRKSDFEQADKALLAINSDHSAAS